MTDPALTTICLVRHGETDWNAQRRFQGRRDVTLNDLGREQARLTGAYLKQWSWDGIVASPLARARESAQIIADALGRLPVSFMDDLMEVEVGAASGLVWDEVNQRWPDGNIPGYETHDSLVERGTRAINTVASEYPGRRLVVVTHGAILNAILSSVSRGEIGTGKTRMANACINLLSHCDGDWAIESYNQVDHLAGIIHRDNEKVW